MYLKLEKNQGEWLEQRFVKASRYSRLWVWPCINDSTLVADFRGYSSRHQLYSFFAFPDTIAENH